MQARRLLDDAVGDFFVLFQNAGLGVQDQDRDVAARNGFLRTLHAEKFHGVVNAARFADARRVHEHIFFSGGGAFVANFDFKRHIHRIARRAGNRTDDDAFGFRERVDDGRFADIGPADNRQP